MRELRVVTMGGTERILPPAQVELLKGTLRGELLCPEDEDYEPRRRLWNGMIDKRP